MSTASRAIVSRAPSIPRETTSASSACDIRGMWICTSARSIERCSAISCSTSSATPTRTIVAPGSSSDSVLIVSANSRRSSFGREPVELVDEDRDPPAARERLEPASHVVRRRVLGQQRRRAHLSLAGRRSEADSGFRDGEAELAERLAPHAFVVVAPVAGRPRGDDARGREHFGGDADERGLADAALAVDHGVLPWLLGNGEEIAELACPPREEALAIDRCGRAEHLGERPQPLDLLRFPTLQPACHPASIVRPDRPRDKPA